jgi:N-acetyl-beta-hexosaminidase
MLYVVHVVVHVVAYCPWYQPTAGDLWLADSCDAHPQKGEYLVSLPLDMTKALTYNIIEAVINEVAALFPDPLLHLGHDEPPHNCWDEDTEQLERMKTLPGNPSSVTELQRYFMRRIIDMVRALPTQHAKQPMFWAEPAFHDILFANQSLQRDSPLITQAWLWNDHARRLAESGFRVIQSHGWYLDGLPGTGSGNWSEYYERDVMPPDTRREVAQLIIGGEACAWELAESADFRSFEGSQLVYRRFGERVWHNLVGIAERMWSISAPKRADASVQARVEAALHTLEHTMRIKNILPLKYDNLL